MPALNQKTWLSLENYVLENTRTHGFKVAVFTGPVFGKQDREYSGVLVPERFWKVIAAIDAESRNLLSSSYLLSQEGFMPEEGFRFGPFKTYQVPLTLIEEVADLKFERTMREADVFTASEAEFMGDTGRFIEINDVSDIVLTRKRRH
jgi:endonuclease G, mitochondrial